jgi:FixJ family two-component response regulator
MMSNSSFIVAVIDDEDLIRDALAAILPAFGCDVETYESADAFLRAVGTSRACCLMIDVHLGLFSGLALGRGLAQAGFKYPVIYMSASTDESIHRQACDAGCVAFLRKPFVPEELSEALDAARGREATCWH